jgi:hypothetical protein
MARQEAPERRQRRILVERDSVKRQMSRRGSSRSTAAHARRQVVDMVGIACGDRGGPRPALR